MGSRVERVRTGPRVWTELEVGVWVTLTLSILLLEPQSPYWMPGITRFSPTGTSNWMVSRRVGRSRRTPDKTVSPPLCPVFVQSRFGRLSLVRSPGFHPPTGLDPPRYRTIGFILHLFFECFEINYKGETNFFIMYLFKRTCDSYFLSHLVII